MLSQEMKTVRSKLTGLTLLEVMVALLVVGIALAAIMQAVSHYIRSTEYIQNKTIATLVANEILTEAKLGLLNVDALSHQTLSKTNMLGRDWYWELHLEKTQQVHIEKITVTIYTKPPDETEKAMVTISGYLHAE